MDARSFIMGNSNPGFSFVRPGDRIVGQIIAEPVARQMKVWRNGQSTDELAFWPSGDPKMQLVIQLQTSFRNYEGIKEPKRDTPDDGKRSVYINGKHREAALRNAIRDAGAQWLEVGGWFDETYTGDDYESKAGIKPKLSSIRYAPPRPGQQGPVAHPVQPVQPVQPQVPLPPQFGGQPQGNPWGIQPQQAAPQPPQTPQWYVQHAPVGYTDPMPTQQVQLPGHHEQGMPPEWATPVMSAPPVQVSGAPVSGSPVSPPPQMSTLQAIRASRAEMGGATEQPDF